MIIVASLLMLTLVGMVTLGRLGRGCIKVISEHGLTLFGSYLVLHIWVDVLVMHSCQLHVCLLHLHSICLFHYIVLIMVVVSLS